MLQAIDRFRLVVVAALRRKWRLCGLFAALAVLALAVSFSFEGARSWFQADFHPLYFSAQLLIEGADPYVPSSIHALAKDAGLYHPEGTIPGTTPFWLAVIGVLPAVGLSPYAAGLVWFFASLAATVFGIALTLRLFADVDWPGDGGDLRRAGVFTLAFAPLLGSLFIGQSNQFVFPLAVVGAYFYRERETQLAAVALGLAAAVKVFPAAFGLIFLLDRDWKAAGTMVASFVFLQIPALLAHPSAVVTFVESSFQLVTANPTSLHPLNQSIWAFARRLTDQNQWSAHISGLSVWVVYGIAVTGMIAAVAWSYLRLRGREESRLRRYWLCLGVGCLAAPYFWHHGLVILYPVFLGVFLHSRPLGWALLAIGVVPHVLDASGGVPDLIHAFPPATSPTLLTCFAAFVVWVFARRKCG